MSYECGSGCNGCGGGMPSQQDAYASNNPSQDAYAMSSEDEEEKRRRLYG
jgi:hypothetical protein